MGQVESTGLRSRFKVLAAGAIAFAAICVAGSLADALLPPDVPLDANFPSQPSAVELAYLRDAYAKSPNDWPRPRLLADADFTEMAALDIHPAPTDRELALARLGHDLFEDPALSASGHIACQSCHNRRLGWGDALPTPFGHARAKGKRNAMPLFSVGYKSTFFWDGRSGSLEHQALGPLTDAHEMANDNLDGVVARINAKEAYRATINAIKGDGNSFEAEDIVAALAAFQRTLERPTRFDRYLRGDQKALTDTQVWGLHIFRTKAGCANCHNGPLLSDNRFHNIGLSFFNRKLEDLGRFNVTGKIEDVGKFLTPSLRHVSRTAPYMHNGVFPRLEGLIRFYEAAMDSVGKRQPVADERKPQFDAALQKSPQLKSFKLTAAERAALVAFLEAL
ncbi:Cytochrome c551 peroxidase [Hyphomicrobium sulfonivorans]|uniref:Cytochrome c551 peroxidase n=1 Tax=Hyphomicrobium sulfonivorans TaxID=121290 RepID=A0A120CTZ9_HYPSL|nr:Cytochrome c551 peroxidase [Hyphomicrobium sulfonivorans]